jgi:hypothetical protein
MGNQHDFVQYCPNGCYNNSCQNNYNNCTFHAYKLCAGNNIYWYDSCGTQQDLFQNCYGTNLICQYGQCVYQQPVLPPQPVYVAHAKIACYQNNLYWYDSRGGATGLYKNCADANSCTLDSCSAGKCSNTLKCDGTTCAAGSPDYNTYCLSAQAGQNSSSNSNNNSNNANTLSVSFFVKPDQNSNQWQKTVDVGSNGQIYFMVSVANNSGNQANNVNVSANIPSEISSLGNLQINGVQVSGDIVSGINIGSLALGSAKTITFEGKTQTISGTGEYPASKQALVTANVSGILQSDSVSINLNPGLAAVASASSSQGTSGFWAFLKRWYLWILVGLVLIFLFIVVFRRLSSNV